MDKTPRIRIEPNRERNFTVILTCFMNLLLFGSYFFYLMKQHVSIMVERQSALEAIKALAVPGTSFLKSIGSVDLLKSSLFFLLILGMMFLVYMLFSLLFNNLWKRGLFLLAGLSALVIVVRADRVNIPLTLLVAISFTSFFLSTLKYRIHVSFREGISLVLSMALISISLLYCQKLHFFLKARDKFFLSSAPLNSLVSFYYTYSPLATSLISPEKGVYEGLLFYDGFKNQKVQYLDNGIFLSGEEQCKEAADYVITQSGERYFIKSRFGKGATIESLDPSHMEKAIDTLFQLQGFLLLNRAGLYFFPAGILILLFMLTKGFTGNRSMAIGACVCLTVLTLTLIWSVALTGRHSPPVDNTSSIAPSQDVLAIAYSLYGNEEIPKTHIPFIRYMASSESPALRYWGAYYLGFIGDEGDAQSLMNLLSDPLLNVRYQAARSLYRIFKEKSFRPLIFCLLNDPSWYVRCRIFSVFLRAGIIPSPA